MLSLNRVHSLTDFLRNHKVFVERLKGSPMPDVLTVNGRPELVLQSADSYQALLDRLERAENVAGLKTAYAEVNKGNAVPYDSAIKELRKKRGL